MSLNGGLKRPLHKAIKFKPDCLGDPKMLEMPELWDTCQGELLTGSGTSPRERSVLQSTKLKEVGDLKSILTSDMEIQRLKFAQLVFGLALIQYFLSDYN